MKIVIKIGGHVFASPLNPKRVENYTKLLKKLKGAGHKILIVMGGGEEARKYIQAAKKLGGSEFVCDIIGIEVSRLNAHLLIAGLGEDAYPQPPRTTEDLRKALEGEKIVVMGGLQPGQSTNAVGILAAEAMGAQLFINATDVDGVYTSDPKKNPNAKKFDVIETNELLSLISKESYMAGEYSLFDPVAIKIVERSGIPTRIINGMKTVNIERTIKGEAVGTLVKPTRREQR